MTDRYKILAQEKKTQAGSPSTLSELYSVPVPSATTVGTVVGVAPEATSIHVQTMVTSLMVCNVSAKNGTFDIAIVGWDPQANPAAATTVSYLFKDSPLKSATTKILSLGLVLAPGEELQTAIETLADFECDFTLMGIEVVTGGGPNA